MSTRVRTDLDSTKGSPLTMSNHEEGSLMIVTLLLTGRATPYIHNGVVNVGDENCYVCLAVLTPYPSLILKHFTITGCTTIWSTEAMHDRTPVVGY